MKNQADKDNLEPKNTNFYPEGDDLQKFITRRNRLSRIWLTIFMGSTIVAIVALSALLYNIFRDAFGYVAIQNTLNPSAVIRQVEKSRMLVSPHTVSSEDDTELVKGIKNDPYAIGYFGHAYYVDNMADLRAVQVDGVEPAAETVKNGQYHYARPLFLYSAPEVMAKKPHVSAFINFYLNNVTQVVDKIGYFPLSDEELSRAKQAWLTANGMEPTAAFPVIDPASVAASEEPLTITGSSTVFPVSRQMAINFRKAGYKGKIKLEQTGTSAGFAEFCGSSKGRILLMPAGPFCGKSWKPAKK
jgi:ABC-type phosphate transport system substrate-binding protein